MINFIDNYPFLIYDIYLFYDCPIKLLLSVKIGPKANYCQYNTDLKLNKTFFYLNEV